MQKLTQSGIVGMVRVAIRAQRPLVIWGPPGGGKSSLVYAACEQEGREVFEFRANLMDPVDLRGLPSVDPKAGITSWGNRPDFLPSSDYSKPCAIFIDELAQAPLMMKNSLSQLILDRKIGGYHLPKDCAIIIASNRMADGAGTSSMPTHLNNRCIHVEMETDYKEWCDWANEAGINANVVAFIRWRPALLHKFDKSAQEFPSPRSWHVISDVIDAKPEPKLELALYCGAVGDGAATEFLGFLKVARKLPRPEDILANPKDAVVPDEPATLYALSAGLGRHITAKTIANAVTYLDRLPPEFAVLAMKDAFAVHKSELTMSKPAIQWMAKNAKLFR